MVGEGTEENGIEAALMKEAEERRSNLVKD